jgi:dTDP-4-dehydrorhamnose reductase
VYVWRLRIPFDGRDNPRNYLTKLMRYQRLLEATNSISQLDEFVAATFACWENSVPFGIYNITNPGHVTTREVVELILESCVCRKDYQFFENEADFMAKAAMTPRSNCVMDSTKLAAVGIVMTPVREAIRVALKNWRTEAAA